MDWIPIALLVVGAASATGVAWSLYVLWQERYSQRSQRFEKRIETLTEFAQRDKPATLKARHLSQWPWLEEKLETWPPAAKIDRLLLRSGTPYTVSDLLLTSLACGTIGLIAMRVLSSGAAVALLAAGVTGYLPWLVLNFLIARRQPRLEAQLPDVLDFIARSMQAGHAFNSALQMAAAESPQPIAAEFQQAFNEVNVGMPVQQAMSGLAERIDCADMRYFAVSVVINREIGGDLSGLLKGVAVLIRERLKLRLSIKSLTAEARASAWLLGLLPFLLAGLLLMVDPHYLDPLLNEPGGRRTLAYGLLLMLLGALWMNRLTKVRA